MRELATDIVWRKRVERIPREFDEVRFPRHFDEIQQDEEWCELVRNGTTQRVRFHDYDQVYRVSGFYEELFYEQLECCSPSYIANLLDDVCRENGETVEHFRVLDVGAGNGMVGDELMQFDVDSLVGVDIIPEAREATLRDRPEVYDDYCVADLTDTPEDVEKRLRRAGCNCLTSVAALGFGDIPPAAFAKALDLMETPGWMAFNIKEDFLRERDTSGFCKLVRYLVREDYIRIDCSRRYRHRLSSRGKPLHYVAVVARKRRDLDSELLESLQDEAPDD